MVKNFLQLTSPPMSATISGWVMKDMVGLLFWPNTNPAIMANAMSGPHIFLPLKMANDNVYRFWWECRLPMLRLWFWLRPSSSKPFIQTGWFFREGKLQGQSLLDQSRIFSTYHWNTFASENFEQELEFKKVGPISKWMFCFDPGPGVATNIYLCLSQQIHNKTHKINRYTVPNTKDIAPNTKQGSVWFWAKTSCRQYIYLDFCHTITYLGLSPNLSF